MRQLPRHDLGRLPAASAGSLLAWLARRQAGPLLAGVVLGVLWMLAQAMVPWALGRAVDTGVRAGDAGALVAWALVLLGLAVAQAVAGVLRHRVAVLNWVDAALTASQLVGHHVTRVGAAMPTRLPTGEVVSTVATDAVRLGDVFDVSARFAGSVVSYVVVAVLLLQASVPLGLVVLLGVPVTAALLAVVVRPLQRRQAAQREMAGRLTTLAADGVAGLRVLRGVGGEAIFLTRYTHRSQQVRRAGVDVARTQSTLDALQVLLPGAFVVLVTWLGARAVLSGAISAGELVSLYGYAAFLVVPLRTATEAVHKGVAAQVAARRVAAVLALRPATEVSTAVAQEPAPGQVLTDPASGLVVQPGLMTALVSGDPSAAARVAERLGRLSDVEGVPPAQLGGVPLSALPMDVARRRVLVSPAEPQLFTGSVRRELDPHRAHGDDAVLHAVGVAAATDVLEALPRGLDDEVTERGRSLSGGQRQRLALARALLMDPEVLVLIEPTSAVDAHTEALVAERVRGARAGRTTVVVTASPLVLACADEVVLLVDGRVQAVGRHEELLQRADGVGDAYRSVVARGGEQ